MRTRPRPWALTAWRAARAMLLNRQKPMLRVGVAWWPGGRTRHRAFGAGAVGPVGVLAGVVLEEERVGVQERHGVLVRGEAGRLPDYRAGPANPSSRRRLPYNDPVAFARRRESMSASVVSIVYKPE